MDEDHSNFPTVVKTSIKNMVAIGITVYTYYNALQQVVHLGGYRELTLETTNVTADVVEHDSRPE
jgi:hypothetical protein